MEPGSWAPTAWKAAQQERRTPPLAESRRTQPRRPRAMCDGAAEVCKPNREGEVCALRPYRPKKDNHGLSTATFALG